MLEGSQREEQKEKVENAFKNVFKYYKSKKPPPDNSRPAVVFLRFWQGGIGMENTLARGAASRKAGNDASSVPAGLARRMGRC